MSKKKEIETPDYAPTTPELLKTLRRGGAMLARKCVGDTLLASVDKNALMGSQAERVKLGTITSQITQLWDAGWHRYKFAELEKLGLVRREFQTYALTDLGFELTREAPRPKQAPQHLLEETLVAIGKVVPRLEALRGPTAADDAAKLLMAYFDIFPKVTVQFDAVHDYLFVEGVVGAAERVLEKLAEKDGGVSKLEPGGWRMPRDRELALERALAAQGVGVRRTTAGRYLLRW